MVCLIVVCQIAAVWLLFRVCRVCLGLSVVKKKNAWQLRGEKAFLLLITDNRVNSLLAAEPLWQGRVDLGTCFRSPSSEEVAADEG